MTLLVPPVRHRFEEPLPLTSGGQFGPYELVYETYGTLNKARDNAVYICHALTGDAHAALWHEGDARPGWWDVMIGPGKAIDTNRWFVISSNLLGGCRGTTGPSDLDPATGEPLPKDGAQVEKNNYWLRRLNAGEVEAVAGKDKEANK
mgnify:CR=1 FL=1